MEGPTAACERFSRTVLRLRPPLGQTERAGGSPPTWDKTFSWLSASFCRVSSSVGAAVCAAGGSVVPVGGVLYPQPRVVTRAKPRTSSKGLAMRKAPGGSSAPWKNGWGPARRVGAGYLSKE